jgi:hypothetical protein
VTLRVVVRVVPTSFASDELLMGQTEPDLRLGFPGGAHEGGGRGGDRQ